MDDAIQISTINDFIFCPQSLYLHSIYANQHPSTYHDVPQTQGTISHRAIDASTYTTSADYIVGLSVYSWRYNIIGKIDIYHKSTKTLIERKHMLNKIFDGHKMQLWCEALCLQEAGYAVENLIIHSIKDNKQHYIELPQAKELSQLEQILSEMRTYSPSVILPKRVTKNKCSRCIYHDLCTKALC